MNKLIPILVFVLLLPLSSSAVPDNQRGEPKTYVELKEYFEGENDAQDRFNNARFEYTEKALKLSSEETERRFVQLTEYAKDSSKWQKNYADLKAKVETMLRNSGDIDNYKNRMIEVEKALGIIQNTLKEMRSTVISNKSDINQWMGWGFALILLLIGAFITYNIKNGKKEQ